MDFLLLNAAATSKLKTAGVDVAFNARDKPSDHAPAWITIGDAWPSFHAVRNGDRTNARRQCLPGALE
ncbi:MAG: hypothetical protein ABI831_04690 [Betaproteobacteria bacterium]